ncbi:MAG: glycosyltransferase family 39 protein, partial [Candidatus Humimicrobiaceae bacterium]
MLRELIYSIAKLIIPFFLICFVSWVFVKLFNINDLIEKIIIIFLLNWIQIVISLEILSLFNQIKLIPLILFHVTCALVCLIIAFFKKLNLKISFRGLWLKIKNFYTELNLNKVFKNVMLIWLLLILITTLFIGITVPPNNWDSMVYHLTRAAFWHQNNTINHYFTRISLQTENPINAELGLLWIITFCNSDNLVFLIQWLSFLILIVTLYKILRLLGFDKKISFITIFIFSTLDLMILESNTTQNDLVIASFVLITLFLLIRILKSDKISFLYLILAGSAFGLFVGTKGYSYLFIPGFFIFYLIYGKNDFLKFKKFLFLICFCILGIFLFSSYNFIQNYIDFGNIFSSQKNIDLMRIKGPNWKTFISNISRHLASFYQFKDYDFGFSKFIQKVLNHIHSLLKIDISSRSTTIEEQYFYLHTPVFNSDASYFGPVFLIFILPSIFYNLIYFVVLKVKKKAEFLRTKWIDTLKIAVIPVIFFIGYNYIFVWQPWAGRLFISFASLMMINFAMLIDFNNYLNKRVLFKTVLTIILVVSIAFSFIDLFFNEFATIIPYKNKSIFSVNYSDRRYYKVNPKMGKVNNMINSTLNYNSKIGLISGDNDWDYIYFGKNFSRVIKYISDDELAKVNIKNIFKENNFNAIVINTKNISGLYNQLFTHPIIQITGSDFLKYFKPLNECKFLIKDNNLYIQVSGDDPYFENINELNLLKYKPLLISINLYSDKETVLQIYYRNKN